MKNHRQKIDYIARYQKLWDTCEVVETKHLDVYNIVSRLMPEKQVYDKIEEETLVPWWVTLCIHHKECSGSFDKHLHNGDSLNAKTIRHPPGRPQGPGPFTFIDSAVDALMMKEDRFPEKWTIADSLQFLERWNGMGYSHRNMNSPYLWAFTNHEQPGLYVKDHVFDEKARSKNPGCVAMIKIIRTLPGAMIE